MFSASYESSVPETIVDIEPSTHVSAIIEAFSKGDDTAEPQRHAAANSSCGLIGYAERAIDGLGNFPFLFKSAMALRG